VILDYDRDVITGPDAGLPEQIRAADGALVEFPVADRRSRSRRNDRGLVGRELRPVSRMHSVVIPS
jgi:hypothetical protein